MAKQREVYYVLLDASGQPFNGKCMDKVRMSSDGDFIDFRRNVKEACDKEGDDLKGIGATKLRVYLNETYREAGNAVEGANIDNHGKEHTKPLVVVVPELPSAARPLYFIDPEVQKKVEKAVFLIAEEESNEAGIGMGVFFTNTVAVTCDHNLTAEQTVGSLLTIQSVDQQPTQVQVVARNSELDFAILKSSNPRAFIPPWTRDPVELKGSWNLVLASYRIGIDEYQPMFQKELGFCRVNCITLSHSRRHLFYSCPTFAGDSGAALIIEDGCLVGIHLETINALREQIERQKLIKDRLSDVEESLDNLLAAGLAQGGSALLAHQFVDAVKNNQYI